MSTSNVLDRWIAQFNRDITSFLDNPSTEMENKLLKLIEDYKNFYHTGATPVDDEHERLMDYR